MDNVVIGPNARVAKTSATFAAMGLNALNTTIVYEAEGAYKSWKPGRLINGITGVTKEKGYIVISKKSIDLSSYLAPPITGGFSFRYIVADDDGNAEV